VACGEDIMPLVYVTGISASGKSTVLEELRKRGYRAYGVDEDGFGRWVDRRTGEEHQLPEDRRSLDLHKWIAEHDWVVDVERIALLSDQSSRKGEIVYLCGVASGDAEVWEYFDQVCALVVDDDTIRERVARRTNVFGKRPSELAQILGWNVGNAETYRELGAVIIDATQSPGAVADAVVSAAESGLGRPRG
jgi:dephospho-CoA kinase